MKYSTRVLLGLAPLANAFPAAVMEKMLQERETGATLQPRQAGADAATLVFEDPPTFSEKQLISVTGDHAWVAPGPGDLRGPCPGLNAFANHGYLPHNGYATITQFIDATTNVVGMGPTLAAFLAVLGASIDGSGTAWSIGGTPGANIPKSLLGDGNGISGSHNKYESDASPTRPDLYETGNDYQTQVDQFNQLIAASPNNEVNLDTLTAFRSTRFDTQIANNKYFFNGPFTGVLVQPAAYTFIYRFMANHSAENPVGLLDYPTIASWFGMEKAADGSYQLYNGLQGQERIPENWYRRSFLAPYENDYFLADAAAAIGLHPKFANVGGNLGKTNSFAGVDVTNLTGGAFNAQSLTQGNNFACLAYQFATQVKPDVALGALTAVTNALSPILGALSCPQLESIDESQLSQFPGYAKSGVAPS